MKRIYTYSRWLVLAAAVFSVSGSALAQNPTLITFPERVSCTQLSAAGHIPPGTEDFIIGHLNGEFRFDETFDIELFGIPTSVSTTRSEAGNDFLADWESGPLQPVAIIVAASDASGAGWNAYVYDPTLPSDTRLHNNGPNEADAIEIRFMKFCYLPTVPPSEGCTRTQGYWGTHSEHGPAPYDDTWALLPNGSDTDFYTTGLSWYEMFQENNSGGNKYIGLAHQWMAATLNGLAGADLSDVANEMADGEVLLIAWASEWDNPQGYPVPVRNEMNAIASVLDSYNNGDIGPGHCDTTPVELTSFTAFTNGSDIQLRWETASETNNAGFEVQVRDRGSWMPVGFVDGHGTTSEAQQYSFTATEMAPGIHSLRLKQIDFDGAFEYHGEVEAEIALLETHELSSAYPNPFNPTSKFAFVVAADQVVSAVLYNALGQRVSTIYSGIVEAGRVQEISVDGSGLPSGNYIVRLLGERFVDSIRVTLLK